MQIWGAEYQENNAFLCRPDDLEYIMKLSKRENCPVTNVGVISDDGRVTVSKDALRYEMVRRHLQ